MSVHNRVPDGTAHPLYLVPFLRHLGPWSSSPERLLWGCSFVLFGTPFPCQTPSCILSLLWSVSSLWPQLAPSSLRALPLSEAAFPTLTKAKVEVGTPLSHSLRRKPSDVPLLCLSLPSYSSAIPHTGDSSLSFLPSAHDSGVPTGVLKAPSKTLPWFLTN